jgi:hypothetical protein
MYASLSWHVFLSASTWLTTADHVHHTHTQVYQAPLLAFAKERALAEMADIAMQVTQIFPAVLQLIPFNKEVSIIHFVLLLASATPAHSLVSPARVLTISRYYVQLLKRLENVMNGWHENSTIGHIFVEMVPLPFSIQPARVFLCAAAHPKLFSLSLSLSLGRPLSRLPF